MHDVLKACGNSIDVCIDQAECMTRKANGFVAHAKNQNREMISVQDIFFTSQDLS